MKILCTQCKLYSELRLLGFQGKRMKFLKITTILTKLPKLLTGVSALD